LFGVLQSRGHYRVWLTPNLNDRHSNLVEPLAAARKLANDFYYSSSMSDPLSAPIKPQLKKRN
jgi:hypothetical protein